MRRGMTGITGGRDRERERERGDGCEGERERERRWRRGMRESEDRQRDREREKRGGGMSGRMSNERVSEWSEFSSRMHSIYRMHSISPSLFP